MFININTPPKAPATFDGSNTVAQMPSVEFDYPKGSEIFGASEPAQYVYQVIEGAVRSYKLLSDGRRQIGAFHLAGDIFGLEFDGFHRFSTEAVFNEAAYGEAAKSGTLGAQQCCNDTVFPEDGEHKSSACGRSFAALGTKDRARACG
jgi:Cyclic nucleotide-binding domain